MVRLGQPRRRGDRATLRLHHRPPAARQHLSFGFGIHRCVGNRLAELQLTIIWEEILKRFPEVRLLEEPRRSYSIFVKGYEEMKVMLPRRT